MSQVEKSSDKLENLLKNLNLILLLLLLQLEGKLQRILNFAPLCGCNEWVFLFYHVTNVTFLRI